MKVKCFIYCLKDPTNSNAVFYVGQTSSLLNDRLIAHVGESKIRNNSKGKIISKIIELGQRPIIELLEIIEGETYIEISAKSNEREKFWVQKYSGLCNKNHAGFDLVCDNCLNKFTAKRARARFCSDVCRASYHQTNPKNTTHKKDEKVTEVKLQVLYNSLLEMVGKINNGLPEDYRNVSKVGIMKSNGEVEPIFPGKPKIKRSQAYFEKIIMDGGCEEPEDHKNFIQEVMDSDLPERIKQNLIVASRVRQS